MPKLNDDDLLIVGRNDTSYTVGVSSVMSSLQDTDLLVVGRADTSYSIKFEDFKTQVGGGGPVGGGIFPSENDIAINPPVLGTGTEGDPYILTTRIVGPAGSTVLSSETISFNGQPVNTDVIWTDNSIGSGTRFSQPVTKTDVNGDWSGQLQYADAPDSTGDINYIGDLQIGTLHFRWVVEQKLTDRIPTQVQSVDLVKSSDGRFTNGNFTFTSIIDDGFPTASKIIDAHVDGSLRVSPVTSEIIAATSAPVSNAPYLGGGVTIAGSGDYVNSQNRWNDLFQGDMLSNGITVWMTNPAGNVIADYMFSAPVTVSSIQFGANITGDTAEFIVYSAAGGTDGSQTFNQSLEVRSIDITRGPITGFRIQQAGGGPENVDLRWVGFNNQAWGSSNTQLTLADNKDLSVFQPGDLVQQNSSITTQATAFSTTLYTGDSTSNHQITTGVDNASGSLVWIKCRDLIKQHILTDTVRGVSGGAVQSNDTAAALAYEILTNFGSNSFTVNNTQAVNETGKNYVAWSFRKAPKFFDIQTYTGDGIAGRTVAHNLGSKPGMMLVKATGIQEAWVVYHQSEGATKFGTLNSDAIFNAISSRWNDTEPTSTVFTCGSDVATNGAGEEYVAYLFADEPGLIKCSSYIGNGTTGQTIDCGFTPAWVLIKNTSKSANWCLFDNARGNEQLVPNTTNQGFAQAGFSFAATGFTLSDNSTEFNFSGDNYIYVAIAENAMADASVTPAGLFQSTTGNTITLTPQVDGWSANTGNTAVGDERITDNGRLYLKFNSNGDVQNLIASPQDPPYTTTDTNPSLNLTFPSTFPSGETPDVELPEGTTLTVGVFSENVVNRSPVTGYEEATIQPVIPVTVSDLFATTLYTGDNTDNRTITTGIDNTGKALLWQKNRAVGDNFITDTVRGTTVLNSNTANPEAASQYISTKNYTSTGCDVDYNPAGWANRSGEDYVLWNFRAAPNFFDIQTYTGDGVAGRTVAHNLGSVPGMIIVKNISTASDWAVYHKELGATKYLKLNGTDSANTGSTYWEGTEPTDSVFTLGDMSRVNSNNDQYVAYLFADAPGLIKCGSYVGNSGNQTIDCGFKVQWLLIKRTTDVADWVIVDTARGMSSSSVDSEALSPNLDTIPPGVKIASVANGFELNESASPINTSGDTYIYVAIAAPVVTSMTAAQFAETQAKFSTYELRSDLYKGEQAKDKVDELTKKGVFHYEYFNKKR